MQPSPPWYPVTPQVQFKFLVGNNLKSPSTAPHYLPAMVLGCGGGWQVVLRDFLAAQYTMTRRNTISIESKFVFSKQIFELNVCSTVGQWPSHKPPLAWGSRWIYGPAFCRIFMEIEPTLRNPTYNMLNNLLAPNRGSSVYPGLLHILKAHKASFPLVTSFFFVVILSLSLSGPGENLGKMNHPPQNLYHLV